MSQFKDKVLEIVAAIPAGEVRTYKEVASLAGSPNAARAVGTILKSNQDINIPCHRVIKSNGRVGNYNGLRSLNKLELLKQEGADLKKKFK